MFWKLTIGPPGLSLTVVGRGKLGLYSARGLLVAARISSLRISGSFINDRAKLSLDELEMIEALSATCECDDTYEATWLLRRSEDEEVRARTADRRSQMTAGSEEDLDAAIAACALTRANGFSSWKLAERKLLLSYPLPLASE